MENDTEQKVLDVIWDKDWINVDSQLNQDKVNYFLEQVQPRLEQKYSFSELELKLFAYKLEDFINFEFNDQH